MYLAFVLDDKSREHMISYLKPSFSKVICHHVTIEFNLTPKNVAELKERKELDGEIEVAIYGIARGDGVDCLLAQVNGERDRRDGGFYHVTLSVEPPQKPVASNFIERSKFAFIKQPAIEVTGSLMLVKK
jgi:hypothetical protein